MHVLIVEDEAMLRSSMARGLAKLKGVKVSDVMNVADALEVIDASAPGLIISDIDLPDRSGIELLGELASRGLTTPIVYVSAYLTAYQAQIPRHANVAVLEKPVPLDTLREIVTDKLSSHRAADATPEEAPPFTAADYVQIACLGRHSVVINVHASSGDEGGTIHVVDGQAWAASDHRGEGEQAFGRLAFAQDATVRCSRMSGPPPDQTLTRNWEALLMDCARLADEEQRSASSSNAEAEVGDLDASFDDLWSFDEDSELAATPIATSAEPKSSAAEITSSELDRQFEELWDRAVHALLDKEYTAALEALVQAQQLMPDDNKVATNIQRLHDMGISLAPSPPTEPQ